MWDYDPNIAVAVIAGLFGGGFTSLVEFIITFFVTRSDKKKEVKPEDLKGMQSMILAMTQDRIVYLGKQFLAKGSVGTWDKAMLHQLYDPYHKAGGNHYAREIVEEVDKLPVEEG